jgi:hypothetical protein
MPGRRETPLVAEQVPEDHPVRARPVRQRFPFTTGGLNDCQKGNEPSQAAGRLSAEIVKNEKGAIKGE